MKKMPVLEWSWTYSSPLGPLILEGEGEFLRCMHFGKSPVRNVKPPAATLKKFTSWLDAYFQGSSQPFPWEWISFEKGTPFQKRVWQELWKIPYGETISYKELARRVKLPQAARAVGNANGKNPLPLFIPCHRVIAANGSLGGYSSGLKIKSTLLKGEGINLSFGHRTDGY